MSWDFRVYANATTTATAFTGTSTTAVDLGGAARVVLVARAADAAIKWGTSAVAAATAGNFPVIANQYLVFDVPPDVTHFRVIRAAATSGTLHWAVVA